ncbi:MAG: hypothetical protein NT045_09720 [Candidatus Aureabacteria bacterium]|nr:hypothetical protein [Candidatus Auribacterota bacterium]
MSDRVKHRFRKEFLYYSAVAILGIARFIPLAVLYGMGTFGGWCAYYLLARERRKTLEHLALAYGDENNASERAVIARAVFMNLGRNLAEIAFYPRLDPERVRGFISMEGREILERARENGKGIIIITGHIGNWELIPTYFLAIGFTGGVVARRIYYEKYERLLYKLRRSKGFRVFYRDESPREILKTLRNNEVVGILADQDVRKLPGVFVSFYGRPAYTPSAPVLIAMKSGAPLIPAHIVREGRRHKIIIEEPISLLTTGDRDTDLVHNTQLWTRCIERYVRSHPDQWVWMHRRWRTRPGNHAGDRGKV